MKDDSHTNGELASSATSHPVRQKLSGALRNGQARLDFTDVLPLLETLLRRWQLLLIGGAALAFLGFMLGTFYWKSSYTAPAQLIRYDSPSAAEVFGERQAAPQTLPSILHSTELLQRVGAKASPQVSADVLAKNLRVMPEHDSDIIVVAITGGNPGATVALANLYAREAVRFTQEMQANAAREIVQFDQQQLAQVESEISAANEQEQNLSQTTVATIAPQTSTLIEKIQAARDELAGLLARYTDAHPLVQEKRAEINALEKELPSQNSASAATISFAPSGTEHDVAFTKLQSLEGERLTLVGRKEAAGLLTANPPGYCQLLAQATDKDLIRQGGGAKTFFLAAFMSLLGFVGMAAAILFMEIADNRLKSAADVRRVARLPVFAVAGDFSQMSAAQKENWAFRTWTNLQGRLSPSPNRGLVCGVTSANHGEGRSTWVNRLARAANQGGFRVLTIATRSSHANGEANGFAHGAIESPASENENLISLGNHVLAAPAEVAQKLRGPEPQPIVHIPLPGWVWNLERRKQWQDALHDWSRIENVVILIELPPASAPEAVLLAENLPNVIWLAASGKSGAAETREQLETLRHARCKLAGAVVNHAPGSILQNRFRRWHNYAAASLALIFSILLAAENSKSQTATDQTAGTSPSFSVVSSAQRAPWQQRLTLGAGDVLNFSLYGEPTLTQLSVPIGPDGRVSFLEAQDVQAAGLTVDELRAKMDDALGKYRRAPHSIITPVAFSSKKYFMLGSVTHGGVFTLDRPITIVEAVARAHGLQTVLQQRDLVEIADLQRAFLARQNQRIPVDFEKLFEHGDLSQNIQIAPDDYLCFPPAELKQVYVVGEVLTPGAATCTADTSALRAIAEQGGFTHRAWKQKILVIRGSLNNPQTFVVDADAVLAAHAPDFKLEPDDIVYVHYRPWIKAEELLDLAASAFVQSVTIYWTGLHVGPLITSPIFN